MTFPIVLAHGVCRFDLLWNETLKIDNNDDPKLDNLHYFKGIRTALKQNGFSAFHTRVNWAAGVDTRAENLKRNILQILAETNAKKVNIIAHSMGGLDARHMLFKERNESKIHERVASLTTISTPHHGSPFADWGTDNLPHVISIAQRLGLDLNAFKDLRTNRCREFNSNAEVIDFEKNCESIIKFQTYAGRQKFWGVFDALKLSFYIIEKKEGDNDGLVSVQSAKWKDEYFIGTIDNTDHLNELGWGDPAQIWTGETEGDLLQRIHKLYVNIAKDLT